MDKKQGIIIKIFGDIFIVKSDRLYKLKAKMKFKKSNTKLLVGDRVLFDENYILEILPRKIYLIRPPISNIDQVLLVVSATNPEFNTNLLDKFLCIIEFNNVKPIICMSKMDLLNECEYKKITDIMRYYENIGYQVLYNTDIETIRIILKNKVTVFSGQSGVGKSTLLNKINSEFKLKTGDISYKLQRGKNTTRHVELLEISDGYVADTPGFSSLELLEMNNTDIRDNFIEFSNFNCKYRDCMHINEDDCGVKNAVKSNEILKSRYDSYKKFINKED